MTPADPALSALELDALTEIVNIGVSQAASNLRKMVPEEILLSVPAIQIVTHHLAATLIAEREGDSLIAVRQDFAGALHGRALLIFPQENGLELVRAVVGQVLPDEEAEGLEDEALAETGNVILNSCLASMANMLRRSLRMSLPQVLRGPGRLLLDAGEVAEPAGLVLFFYINFAVRDRNIRGYIAMVMDLPSLAALKLLVNDFIERVMSDDLGEGLGAP
ncbi:chemotaxis protein CheX [Siccirubricoccus sp. KC 17139]|uniref:Chemotaxis protein CheX n=1 Tax=Siccirubricoccus soli TaxID=2899147 RepID=A0ABT1DDF1_9PROT|nr:chemotaxis protein CheX [Siccirubricoccus soli]MCP2686102.1 chemotaxis protein CheX [Siccirubricoccus soli]